MRIGIDARIFKYKQFSGIPGSIFDVLKEWMKSESNNEYFLISSSEIELPCDLPDNWKKVIVPVKSGNGTLWQLFKLRGIIKKLNLDWYWGTNFMLPNKVRGCKYLLTIHDLAFEIMPEVVSQKTLYILKMLCRKSCKNADVIHAVSASTKNDIVAKYGISPEKISVVYWGTREIVRSSHADEDKPDYKYMLVLGTIEPRKNIETIVRAFDEFKKSDNNDVHIIFAGKYGWKYENFNRLVEESKYKSFIHILSYVDDDKKETLLDNAELLLYPSLYEGFGLPILEAFQHELFVVTANNSSIPEIAGEAAFYVDDARDYIGIAEQIEKVLNMDEQSRNRCKEAMRMQLDKFSWDDSAAKIMELLKA